jgi:hypothetical protein
MAHRARAGWLKPWRRLQDHLDRATAGPRPGFRLALIAVFAVGTWWLYVPLHELAHAGACLSCGGEVRRMTLAPRYGGSIAARLFDWIDDETPYAGQLADFTTGGSDLCYLWLVLAPFAATPLARPLLRRAARRRGAAAFAVGMVLALMPVMNIPGDFYEAGSIVVTRAAADALPDAGALRSDDLPALLGRLGAEGADTPPRVWAAALAGAALGTLGAFALTALALPPVREKS